MTVLDMAQTTVSFAAGSGLSDPNCPTVENIAAAILIKDSGGFDFEQDMAVMDRKLENCFQEAKCASDLYNNNPADKALYARFRQLEQQYAEIQEAHGNQVEIQKMLLLLHKAQDGAARGGHIGVLRWLAQHRQLAENQYVYNAYDNFIYCWLAKQGYRHPENLRIKSDGNPQTHAIGVIGKWMRGVANGTPPSAAELAAELQFCENLAVSMHARGHAIRDAGRSQR